MAVNPRGRLKLIVITSIAVLFLSGANFGNAQTMDKIVDCDASFSKHFGKYGYKSGEGEFKDFLGEYYCSWELKSLDTNSAYSHEADARIFPVFSANIFLRTSDDCELGCTLFRAYIDDRVVDEWTDLENVFGGKLIIRYDRPKPEQAGNSGLELRVETGKCRVSLNGRAGIGNWGSAGLEPSYSSFHYNDPDDVTNHINEHPESDHGLSTAKKEILKTAGQLMADLEPLCGGTTLIQPSVAEKISTPEEQEIKGTTYNNFREYYDRLFTVVDNILYRVPVPDIPENTTYEQCQEICGDYGRNTLVDACQNSDTLKGLEAEFLVRGLRNLGSVTSCKSISIVQGSACYEKCTPLLDASSGLDATRRDRALPSGAGNIKRTILIEPQEIMNSANITADNIERRAPKLPAPADSTTRGTNATSIFIEPGTDIQIVPLENADGLDPETEDIMQKLKDQISPPDAPDYRLLLDPLIENADGLDPETEDIMQKLKDQISPPPDKIPAYTPDYMPPSFGPPVSFRINHGEIELYIEGGEQINLMVPQGEIRNLGTHFWVRVTEEGHTVVGVYKGAVMLTSLLTRETQRVVPDTDSKPGIAMLRFLTSDDFVGTNSEKKGTVWLWIIVSGVLVVGGWGIYQNKRRIAAIFKKTKIGEGV